MLFFHNMNFILYHNALLFFPHILTYPKPTMGPVSLIPKNNHQIPISYPNTIYLQSMI